MRYRNWLVVQFAHLEKYYIVNGKDDNPYMKWKIKHVPNHQPGNSNVIVKYPSRIVLDLFIFGPHMGWYSRLQGRDCIMYLLVG